MSRKKKARYYGKARCQKIYPVSSPYKTASVLVSRDCAKQVADALNRYVKDLTALDVVHIVAHRRPAADGTFHLSVVTHAK
jgi:hypothetical protein